MRKWILVLVLISAMSGCLALSGCIEEFVAGFGAGAAAMETMANDVQADFIETVNKLNAEKAKYEELIAQVQDAEVKEALQKLIDEQTLEAIEDIGNTDWSDPKVLGGYGLALASLLTAGYQKKKRMSEAK